MWRKRRGSYGGGSTLRGLDSPPRGSSNSLTGFPSGGAVPAAAPATPLPSLFGPSEVSPSDTAPHAFAVEVPTPGPLGLDLRARHVERGRPQRGAIVKGFRPLAGGAPGYVESTGRVRVGDILEGIHKTRVDELPFDQIVAHALQLQKDATAWPLRLEFRRERAVHTNAHASGGGGGASDADRASTTSRPRRGSFFRSSVINPVQDSTNFNEKLNYFRGFFSNRMPTGGAAPKAIEKPPRAPSHDTVDEMYRDLLLKRGVPDDVMDELVRIESIETKWHVVWYAQQHANEATTQSSAAEAARFAENLVELGWDNKGLKELEALRNKIAAASTDWLEAFLASFGLDYLTMKLPDPSPFPLEHSKYEKATKVCEVILRILRSLTHFTAGVEAMTNTPGLVKRVALCFHTENGDVKKYTLQLLGIVCYNSAAGHQAVIEAFDHYKETKGESIRFSCLRDALKSTRYSLVFKEDVLSFVNIIVNKAIRLEDRLAIRSDFMALKMAGYFEEIRAKSLAVQQKASSISKPSAAPSNPPSAAPSPALRPQPSPAITPAPSPALGPLPGRKLSTVAQEFALESSPGPSPGLREPGTPAPPPPKARQLSSPEYAGNSQSVPNLFRSSINIKSAPPSPVERETTESPVPREDGRSSLPPENKFTGKSTGKSIISSTVTQLRNQLDNMEKQIDVFERFMEDDRKDTIYGQTDLSSPDSVYRRLNDAVLSDPELQACFLSILQQLLFIPGDTVIGKEMWALTERIVKQIALLAPVEEVRSFELGYDDRKTLMKMRDRYTGFLQKCAEEDPSFQFRIGPVILIQNREHGDDLLSDTADETDDEELADQVVARDHPELAKYFKLLKMGMPIEHVKTKMRSELPELDASVLDTPDRIIQLGKPGAGEKEGTRAEEHPKYAKFFKLKKMGMPLPHIQLKMSAEGLDPGMLDTPDLLLDDEGSEVKEAGDAGAAVAGTPVKEHDKFAKFFKLLKMGMPMEHVKLKASAEGLDAELLDAPDTLLDEEGNLFVDSSDSGPQGVAVRDHDKFAKFFKLLKMGMPMEHVKLKASAEGLDAALLDAPDTLLDEEGNVFVAGAASGPQGVAVRDHDKFAKFFKLLKMGMPMEHVKLKASAEGLDAELLETPDALVNEDGSRFTAGGAGAVVAGTPVKEHDKFAKFFKLLKMGMPMEHVKLKASAEGLDAELLETPDALVDADGKRAVAADDVTGTPAREHPKFVKFFKLLKMGMPLEHVKLKASAEGLDASLLETPDALLDEDGKAVAAAVKGTPVKEHDKFAKFFKLLKMGMPMEHVKLKASAEGLDAELLETPDALVDADGKAVAAAGKKVKASEHPRYAKYFKLLKMGMPRPQVELKLGAEGLDAKVLDAPDGLIPEDLSSLAPGRTTPAKPAVVAPPKPKLRNLYWEPVKQDAVAGTIWEGLVCAEEAVTEAKPAAEAKPGGPAGIAGLLAARAAAGTAKGPAGGGPRSEKDAVVATYVKKLADVFASQPAKAKEAPEGKKAAAVAAKRRAPTRVALIDVKRANNIGIMLARFRLPYTQIRDAVLTVDKEVLSSERVSAMMQFAPEPAELEAVRAYAGDPKLLGDAEQYFRALLRVPRLPTRLQALHATWQFDTYVEEQRKLVDAVASACRELRACTALREILSVVLSLGNALNDGTARGGATGFRLGILLKLNQVKASDNSMTLLNYVAKVLRAKDPSALDFDKALPSVESASRVTLQVLKAGEAAVRKAAALICDELAAHSKLPEPPQPAGDEAEAAVRDRFQEVVGPFADRATQLSEAAARDLESMTRQFEETVTFYGEDPASPECGPDAFFSIFYSFAKVLQAADRDNERKRVAEERRVRREEETRKRLEALKSKKKNTSLASLKAGDVDDIVSKIRAKRVEEKRRERRDQPPGSSSSSRGGAAVATSPTAQLRASNTSRSGDEPPLKREAPPLAAG